MKRGREEGVRKKIEAEGAKRERGYFGSEKFRMEQKDERGERQKKGDSRKRCIIDLIRLCHF